MKGWLLDTNVVSEPSRAKPDGRVLDWMYSLPRDRTFISVLTLAEVDSGVEALAHDNPRRTKYARFRRGLEAEFSGRVLPLDNETVRLWGILAGRYQRQFGGRVPPVDGLLAANAQRQRLYLATRNLHDVQRLGVSAFDPWTDEPAEFPLER